MIVSVMLVTDSTIDTTLSSNTTKRIIFYQLDLGGMEGSYVEVCGGIHRYRAGGAGLSFNLKEGYSKTTLGIRGYFGQEDYDTPYIGKYIGINPYGRFDTRFIGGSLGSHFIYGHPESQIPLQIGLRLGPSDIFFIEGSVFDHAPAPVPRPIIKLGVGAGFGRAREGYVGFGFCDLGNFYFTAYFPLIKQLMINFFFSSGSKNEYQLNLNLGWRFYF